MKKSIKFTIYVLVILLFFVFLMQYKVESYITQQKNKYGILEDQKRIHYKPYVIFFFEGLNNNYRNNRIESKAFMIPYQVKGVKTVISDKEYDSYLVYCFFTDAEIEQYYNLYNNETIKK